MSEFESSLKPNGFAPKSWGDILAIVSLLAMFMAALAWGLKLEAQLETLRVQHFEVTKTVNRGILPIAEERILLINNRLERVEANLERLHENVHKGFPLK